VALSVLQGEINAQVAANGLSFTALPTAASTALPEYFEARAEALDAAVDVFIGQINVAYPGALTVLPTAPSSSDPTTIESREDARIAALAAFAEECNYLIKVDAAQFDGTNDHMARGAGLTGAADSKKGIISAWVRLDVVTAGYIFGGFTTLGGSAPRVEVSFNRLLGNKFGIECLTPTNTVAMEVTSVSTYAASGTWLHILFVMGWGDWRSHPVYQ